MALIIEIGGPDKRVAPVIIRTALDPALAEEKKGEEARGDQQNQPLMSLPSLS